MRYTTKRYSYFGRKAKEVGQNLLSKESWDTVRIDKVDNDKNILMSIPRDRSLWLKKHLYFPESVEHAKAIIKLIKSMGFSKVISIGVGAAWLEYNIKKFYPSLHLTCTDFAPKCIQRLREVFLECDSIEEFDILSGNWISQEHTLYLIYRIDASFDDKQWKTIFFDMNRSNIRYVLFVPHEFLTCWKWAYMKMRFLKHKMLGRQITFAGYFRTKDTFQNIWVPYYNVKKEISIGQLSGFLLKKNNQCKISSNARGDI